MPATPQTRLLHQINLPLAMICFVLAILGHRGPSLFGVELQATDRVFDVPVWGIFMGIGMYLLINGNMAKTMARKFTGKTPSTGVLATWTLLSLGVGGLLTGGLAAQTGVFGDTGFARAGLFNPYMIGTMIGLALLFPTPVQGLMVPQGDERFRANQHLAATMAFRVLVGTVILLAFADYGKWWDIGLSVSGTAALTLAATVYNGVLWLQERSDR